MRYGHVKTSAKVTRGTIFLGPGYAEPIEKYYELMRELTAEGYDLWIMDWAGQGGSTRHDPKDRQRSYDVEDFVDHHCADLYHLVTKVAKVPDHHKIAYMGSSMGGHIGLRFVGEYPHVFDTIAVSSALVGLQTGGLPMKLVERMTTRYRRRGQGGTYVPGGRNWSKNKSLFFGNLKTSDPIRFKVLSRLFLSNERLQVGDVRIDWLHHVMPSLRKVSNRLYLEKLKTPIFMSIAGKDKIVSVRAQRRAVKSMFNACSMEYKSAKHELWMERDDIRDRWLGNVLKHLAPVMDDIRAPVRFTKRFRPIHTSGAFSRRCT